MEKRGIPTVAVCSDRFKRLGEVERRTLGLPELAMAIGEHPFGGIAPSRVAEKAEVLLDQIVAGLTGHR